MTPSFRSAATLSAASDPVTPSDPGLLHALRRATADRHAALDATFPHGLADRRTYVAYLRAMSSLATGLDATPRRQLHADWQPWHDATRLQAIIADLARFGLPPLTWPAASLAPAEWIGACYVFEGSSLGARLLLRQAAALQQRDVDATPALSFLALHAGDTRRWPALLRALATVPPRNHADAIAGAIRAFSVTQTQLKETLAA